MACRVNIHLTQHLPNLCTYSTNSLDPQIGLLSPAANVDRLGASASGVQTGLFNTAVTHKVLFQISGDQARLHDVTALPSQSHAAESGITF